MSPLEILGAATGLLGVSRAPRPVLAACATAGAVFAIGLASWRKGLA